MSGDRARMAERAGGWVPRVVADMVAAVAPEDVVVRPLAATGPLSDPVWSARRPGPVRAAAAGRLLAAVAESHAREQAREARGAGVSWPELATALGFEPDPEGVSAGEVAFEWVAGWGRSAAGNWRDRPSTYWRCSTCGELVHDYGLEDSAHPADRESGHAGGCARQAAAVAAYEASWGDGS